MDAVRGLPREVAEWLAQELANERAGSLEIHFAGGHVQLCKMGPATIHYPQVWRRPKKG